jgi:hypothetical protein
MLTDLKRVSPTPHPTNAIISPANKQLRARHSPIFHSASTSIHSGVAFSDLPVGALNTPNTGMKMYFSGITIFTLKDGKIIDKTGEEGALMALQNLGLLAQPNPGKEVQFLHDIQYQSNIHINSTQ